MAVEKVEDNIVEANKRDYAHIWANELEKLVAWIGVWLGCCGGSWGCGGHGEGVCGKAEVEMRGGSGCEREAMDCKEVRA